MLFQTQNTDATRFCELLYVIFVSQMQSVDLMCLIKTVLNKDISAKNVGQGPNVRFFTFFCPPCSVQFRSPSWMWGSRGKNYSKCMKNSSDIEPYNSTITRQILIKKMCL